MSFSSKIVSDDCSSNSKPDKKLNNDKKTNKAKPKRLFSPQININCKGKRKLRRNHKTSTNLTKNCERSGTKNNEIQSPTQPSTPAK